MTVRSSNAGDLGWLAAVASVDQVTQRNGSVEMRAPAQGWHCREQRARMNLVSGPGRLASLADRQQDR
jgi:hypothetical protein